MKCYFLQIPDISVVSVSFSVFSHNLGLNIEGREKCHVGRRKREKRLLTTREKKD